MNCDLLSTLTGHKDRVWSVKWRHCGKILASCSSDKDIRLWKQLQSKLNPKLHQKQLDQ